MIQKKTIAVGMSGGVDSSVSALLLKQQGYNVIGLFMKNWEDSNGQCSAKQDFEDVLRVCEKINIPYYTLNFSKEYKEEVFASFLKDCQKGLTPNPDILCNKEIKFKLLLEKALDLGADFLATGHYAKTNEDHLLLKAKDLSKDQTYFLYTLNQDILKKVLFPIGNLLKTEVRKIAEENDLCTFNKKDSTGICFIGERNFKTFLNEYIPFTPGNFETLEGQILGKHEGVAFYTIGQRKGLKIGGKGDAWFVVGKDFDRNVVILAQGATHPALYADSLTAEEITWVSQMPKLPLICSAKIRYRQEDQPCVIEKIEDGIIYVNFLKPQRAITPRQSIVFYDNNICLGGAIIKEPSPSYFALNKILGF
ncbi:MAG: tRNA 2-thiouridine(34) synthase MnmA [Chlamydiae bacterium]|nr:tRNA 2-thiouridine(34) synthase MnmA [Chlamydiota bacterium]